MGWDWGMSEDLSNAVDQFFGPRQRLSVLLMEQGVLEFQQLPTSYFRLAAYCMSQHHSLRYRIIVRKMASIRLRLVVGDIPVNLSTEGSGGSIKVAKQSPQKGLQSNSNLKEHCVKSCSSSGKPESDPRTHDSFEMAKVEERIFPGGGSDSSTFSTDHNCSSGTTVISLYIDGCIYSGADGRRVGEYGNIVDGSSQKLHSLKGNKVLGTMCGRALFGKTVLDKAKERLENSVSPMEIMAELKNDAENWTKSQALEWVSETYPSQLGLCWFENDEPNLLLSDTFSARRARLDYFPSDGRKAIVALSGSGSEYARRHLRNRKKDIFDPNVNKEELVLDCLAFSSLYSPSSGGNFQTAVLKKSGELEMNRNGPHLIAQIVKSFDKFPILKVSLIHVTYNVLYNVCGGVNDEMNALLQKTFNGVTHVNVLGIQKEKKITVRLVVFKKLPALFSALRALKGNEKILIPPNSFLDLSSQVKEQKLCWSLTRPKLQVLETLSKEFKTNSW